MKKRLGEYVLLSGLSVPYCLHGLAVLCSNALKHTQIIITSFKRGSPKDKGAFDLQNTSINNKEIKQGRFQCDNYY